jgi:hypothetical protein
MADLIMELIGPDYKKVIEQVDDDKVTVTIEEQVGLDCAAKLFAVCGDNAGNNDTFCNHFYSLLLAEYDDDPLSNSDLPHCRFHGRSSRIRCVAHIISLVVDAIFKKLRSGDRAQVVELLARTADNGGTFDGEDCRGLSIYMKIRAFVLWIQGSDERRAAWRKFCPIMIPLDVDTRWNSVYLMMFRARANRGAITRFGRSNLEVQHLVPTDQEWEMAEVMERCLEPFYDWTLSVSGVKPSLPETIGIMWGLDDLLDDIQKSDSRYGDVPVDIRQAFLAGVAVVDEYTKLINDNIMYYAAAILDPRIKTRLIKEQYAEGAAKIMEDIQKYLKKEFQKSSPEARSRSSDIQFPKGVHHHQLNLLLRARNTRTSTGNDIDRYLDTEVLHWNPGDESNYEQDWVLKWWAANAFQYPIMATAARALLAIPGAEVDVERLFSGGRDLLGIRRYGLNGDTMRILTLLKCYFERRIQGYTANLPEVQLHYFLIGKFKLTCIASANI